MNRIGTKRDKTASGYITESARYKAKSAKVALCVAVALKPVSYTHLDVYKRQVWQSGTGSHEYSFETFRFQVFYTDSLSNISSHCPHPSHCPLRYVKKMRKWCYWI